MRDFPPTHLVRGELGVEPMFPTPAQEPLSKGLCCASPTSRFSLRCGNPRASGKLVLSPWSRKLHLFIFSSQESLWEGDLTLVLIFCRNFSSARQVLRGGCRLDFTSTSVLFIFASLQYYQLLLHMGDPYCALVK